MRDLHPFEDPPKGYVWTTCARRAHQFDGAGIDVLRRRPTRHRFEFWYPARAGVVRQIVLAAFGDALPDEETYRVAGKIFADSAAYNALLAIMKLADSDNRRAALRAFMTNF